MNQGLPKVRGIAVVGEEASSKHNFCEFNIRVVRHLNALNLMGTCVPVWICRTLAKPCRYLKILRA